MADVGKNSIWSDITNEASTVSTDLLGPEYSYADNIMPTAALGVGSDGTFGQMITNIEAVVYYVEALITGKPPLGNKYFVNTGGTCVGTDGQLRSRYNYINNMSSGSAALPPAISMLGSDLNGLIPGVVDDIEGLNPTYLFNAMTSDASPPCECYLCRVTTNEVGGELQWITQSLSPDFSYDQCSRVVDTSGCPPPLTTSESFTNMRSNVMNSIPTVVAGLTLALLVFSGK